MEKYSTMLKWKFISDGEAELDQDWLGWDELIWEEKGGGYVDNNASCYTDRSYIYIVSPAWDERNEWNKLRCVSFDGEVIFDKMMHDWHMPDQYPLNGTRPNSSIEKLYSRGNNRWFLLSSMTCLHQMIDTTRILINPDDESDMVVFENRNGDYFLDNSWQPDFEPAWICIPGPGSHNHPTASSYEYATQRDAICIDSNNFNIIFVSWIGLTSFGVSTQDGTGIGYMSFNDDTNDETLVNNIKGGGQLCDSGSNYDGLYTNAAIKTEFFWWNKAQTYFVAFDSAHGVITNEPTSVEETSPIAFNVEQNTPNPFNPTTTISFTVPGSNHVTVDIYNIMGQKIETLVDNFMNAGKHSFIWDASGFAAGVYFYTVKAGKYKKTMKMTLLK